MAKKFCTALSLGAAFVVACAAAAEATPITSGLLAQGWMDGIDRSVSASQGDMSGARGGGRSEANPAVASSGGGGLGGFPFFFPGRTPASTQSSSFLAGSGESVAGDDEAIGNVKLPPSFTDRVFQPRPPSVVLSSGSTYSSDINKVAIALQIINHILSKNGDDGPPSKNDDAAAIVDPPTSLAFNAPADSQPGDPSLLALTDTNVHAPEPGSMLLIGTGLIGIAATARRRFRRRQ